MIWTTTKLPNLFEDFFMNDTWNATTYMPSSKVETLDSAYSVKVAIPGLTKEDLSIEFDRAEEVLTISYDGEGNEFVSKFKKSYRIPSTVDTNKIKAEVINGVRTVNLPKQKDLSVVKVL